MEILSINQMTIRGDNIHFQSLQNFPVKNYSKQKQLRNTNGETPFDDANRYGILIALSSFIEALLN